MEPEGHVRGDAECREGERGGGGRGSDERDDQDKEGDIGERRL